MVMTLLSHAGDGATELVLANAHQDTTTDCQGAVVDHQGAVVDHQGVVANCQYTDAGRHGVVVGSQGAAADCQGAFTGHQCATVDYQCVTTDWQGAIAGRQDAADLAALRPKKALAMRCVDGGGHRSRCFTLAPRWVPTFMVFDIDLE
jgi:hypothetical protein